MRNEKKVKKSKKQNKKKKKIEGRIGFVFFSFQCVSNLFQPRPLFFLLNGMDQVWFILFNFVAFFVVLVVASGRRGAPHELAETRVGGDFGRRLFVCFLFCFFNNNFFFQIFFSPFKKKIIFCWNFLSHGSSSCSGRCCCCCCCCCWVARMRP